MKPTIAVITPYYKEPLAMLAQGHQSVLDQDVDAQVTHFLVADGFPQTEIDAWSCRHVKLPTAHDDNGNTPRGIGSVLADVEGFDHIAYLDADNWFQPTHLSSLLAVMRKSGRPVGCAWRTLHRPDGSLMPLQEKSELAKKHVDTSGLLLHRDAYDLLRVWTDMPKPLSPICDRIFMAAIAAKRHPMVWTQQATVAFRTQYATHYQACGETPPPGSKTDVMTPSLKWMSTGQGIRETVQRLGFWPPRG